MDAIYSWWWYDRTERDAHTSVRVFRRRQEPGTSHFVPTINILKIIPRASKKHEPNIFLVVSIMCAILSSDRMLRIQQHLLSPFATPSLNHNIRHVKSSSCNKDGPGTSRDATVTAPKIIHDDKDTNTDTDTNHIPKRHGLGRLVATSFDNGKTTQCTTVSYQSPVRLIPLRSTQVLAQGGAMAFLSNYGGGLLPGDVHYYDIHVQNHARLALLTQGHNRIYKQKRKQHLTQHHPEQPIASTIGPQPRRPRQPRRLRQGLISQTNFTARVDPHGFLVMAPDPVTPFASSAYRQSETIILHPTSSLCFIDWFSSGRFANGEHWQQERLETCTTIYLDNNNNDDDDDLTTPQRRQQGKQDQRWDDRNSHDETNKDIRQPLLVDSISLTDGPYRMGMDWGDQWQCNAFSTVFLYGSQVQLVRQRFQQLQHCFLSARTRVRQSASSSSMEQQQQQELLVNLQQTLSGNRVLLSVSHVDHTMRQTKSPTTTTTSLSVVRMAAMSNEDLYRILHYCLLPLAASTTSIQHDVDAQKSHGLFGLEFYKDRIHSTHSASIVPMNRQQTTTSTITSRQRQQQLQQLQKCQQWSQIVKETAIQPQTCFNPSQETAYSQWAMLLLADSSLPTGGFAHSSGLEAAAQLGMLSNRQHVQTFVQTSVQSFLQLSSPVVERVHNHALSAIYSFGDIKGDSLSSDSQEIDAMNHKYHLAIVSNEPACMASLDQGRSLLRVALHWAHDQAQNDCSSHDQVSEKQDGVKGMHCRRRLDLLSTLSNQGEFHPGFHYVTVFGTTAAVFGITLEQTRSLLGYCVARDLVSAAVRLNLIALLASIQEIITTAPPQGNWNRVGDNDDDTSSGDGLVLSSCAPVLDTIQPCHNALAVRLFRS